MTRLLGRGRFGRYFQALGAELGIPYQALINLYLRDCANSGRRLRLDWKASGAGRR